MTNVQLCTFDISITVRCLFQNHVSLFSIFHVIIARLKQIPYSVPQFKVFLSFNFQLRFSQLILSVKLSQFKISLTLVFKCTVPQIRVPLYFI
jgi:hypothetical protein